MVQIHPSLFCLSCLVVYLHITRISTPSFSGLVLAGLGWPGPAGSKFEGTSASFLPSRESSPHVHPRVSNFHDMESIKQFFRPGEAQKVERAIRLQARRSRYLLHSVARLS